MLCAMFVMVASDPREGNGLPRTLAAVLAWLAGARG
jgi:hypothetical protein